VAALQSDLALTVRSLPLARSKAYDAIDSERTYQKERWRYSPSKGSSHSVTEYLVYIRARVEDALDEVSHASDPKASRDALEEVRKIAALAVACMEQHGAPVRQDAERVGREAALRERRDQGVDSGEFLVPVTIAGFFGDNWKLS
jgi:hypothetical protein